MNPKRPPSGPGPHSLGAVSSVAAVWPLMLLGDADGTLMAWDLQHGRCSSIATGIWGRRGGLYHIRTGPSNMYTGGPWGEGRKGEEEGL